MALIRVFISVVIVVPLAFWLAMFLFWLTGTLGISPDYDTEPELFWLVFGSSLVIAAGVAAAVAHIVNGFIFGWWLRPRDQESDSEQK